MDEIRVIDPAKLTARRGWMPRAEVARRTNGVYTAQAIRDIETGRFRPKPEKIQVLLDAYGATWEEVTSPVVSEKPKRKRAA